MLSRSHSSSILTLARPLVTNMSHVLFWLILNLVPWMLSALVLLVNSSALITLFLVNRVPGTTGLKAITLKVLSLSIKFWMWFVVRLKAATVFRVSKSHILLVVGLVPGWVLC